LNSFWIFTEGNEVDEVDRRFSEILRFLCFLLLNQSFTGFILAGTKRIS